VEATESDDEAGPSVISHAGVSLRRLPPTHRETGAALPVVLSELRSGRREGFDDDGAPYLGRATRVEVRAR